MHVEEKLRARSERITDFHTVMNYLESTDSLGSKHILNPMVFLGKWSVVM